MKSLFLLFVAVSSLQSQIRFYPLGEVDQAVPAPSTVLSYELGTRFTEYRLIEKYLDHLVQSSDRVRNVTYGQSIEHRDLRVLLISSPANLNRLEEIRTINRQLTDPRIYPSKQFPEGVIKSLPVIVWLSYSVHGNESSSSEAALATAYQLIAGRDQRTRSILENSIVILDPLVNPDGRERFVQWFNSTVGRRANANPDAIEHNEPWPGGRTNHYYFDLNRDWAWSIQPESQARLALYRQWMPHVHVDYHEMGYTSTYFFFPAATPVHAEFPPEVRKWGEIFGKGNAEAFDRIGVPYYTGESFDLFYPGYGDSWPTFNGAIGMTYEQSGHSRAGLDVEKPGGQRLTLGERVRNHFLTGIATLETAVKHREERIRDFSKFWIEALAPKGATKGFIIPEGRDPNRVAQVINTLIRQGVEVHRFASHTELKSTPYFTGTPRKQSFRSGTFFISLTQPQSRLAKALLEPQTSVPDTFFYDVSAWSLPIAAGIDAYTTEEPLPSSARKIDSLPPLRGTIVGGEASFAYLIPWERNRSSALVWALLRKNTKLHVAGRSFEIDGRYYAAGTVIAFTSANTDSLPLLVKEYAHAHGVDVHATSTGLTSKGINLGSNHVRPFTKPEIAVVTDAPVSSYDYGELWYMFEWEYDIPFTPIRARDIPSISLAKYHVLILPDARDYRSVFDSSTVARIRKWVEDGGVVIGIEEGARFLTKKQSGLTSAQLESDRKDDEKSKEEKEEERALKELAKRRSLFEKEENDRLYRVPGTIFKTKLDTTHPLGYGMPGEVYVLRGDSPSLVLTDAGHNAARYVEEPGGASGYVRADRARKIADSAYLMEFRVGRGRAVLFTENLTFRRFWTGLEKMLINALLFVPPPR